MEIYMEIDSKAVYPHNKERERDWTGIHISSKFASTDGRY
jgi:hypothetical protein